MDGGDGEGMWAMMCKVPFGEREEDRGVEPRCCCIPAVFKAACPPVGGTFLNCRGRGRRSVDPDPRAYESPPRVRAAGGPLRTIWGSGCGPETDRSIRGGCTTPTSFDGGWPERRNPPAGAWGVSLLPACSPIQTEAPRAPGQVPVISTSAALIRATTAASRRSGRLVLRFEC